MINLRNRRAVFMMTHSDLEKFFRFPEGVALDNIYLDHERGTLNFIVSGEMFNEVPEGSVIPQARLLLRASRCEQCQTNIFINRLEHGQIEAKIEVI